ARWMRPLGQLVLRPHTRTHAVVCDGILVALVPPLRWSARRQAPLDAHNPVDRPRLVDVGGPQCVRRLGAGDDDGLVASLALQSRSQCLIQTLSRSRPRRLNNAPRHAPDAQWALFALERLFPSTANLVGKSPFLSAF